MANGEQDRIQLIHLAEQSLATMRSYQADIERISKEGPRPGDDKITQMVCCHVAGQLLSPVDD